MRKTKLTMIVLRVFFATGMLMLCSRMVIAKTGKAVLQSPPDLTVGATRFSIDTTTTYNLGPTGMRGWLFGGGGGPVLQATCRQPWQILVTTVGTGTPAHALLATNDVILGAKAGTGTVPLFTDDARKSLGKAIGDAEAGDGKLSLLVNRYGAGNKTYTLQLGLTGLAYSATAPYNCPKSARILADAVRVITPRTFTLGGPGNPVLGLAKLAAGITNAAVQTYARSICPATGSLQPKVIYDSWGWGYQNLFLCEYRLMSGDTSVDAGITEFSTSLEEAQGMSGLLGHRFTEPRHDGTRGPVGGYGPMHSPSIVAGISLVLATKCGIGGMPTAQLNAGINRISTFERFYVDKGMIPYGEHAPFMSPGRGSNGKDQMAALLFGLQGAMPTQTEYYTRANVASFLGYEYGHTGQGFSYLWGPLGAHVGGTNALAAYLKPLLWRLDMARRCDGSFSYDGREQFGGSSNVRDYWQATGYYGIDPTASHVLLFSLPQRRIYLTGKNPTPANTLNSAAVSNAVWAGWYATNCTGYTTKELIGHFAEYDPIVRWLAAKELATRPGSKALVSTLITLTTSTDRHVREAACQALGEIKDTKAIPALVARMSDRDVWTRTKAGDALNNFGAAALPYLTNMMTAYIATGSKNRYNIDWNDPLRLPNAGLGTLLFTTLGAHLKTVPANLFCDAIEVGLANPEGRAQGPAAGVMKQLSLNNVKMVAPGIVNSAKDAAPFDRMFGWGHPVTALETLAKYNIEEGIPLAVRLVDKYLTCRGGLWGGGGKIVPAALNVLSTTYRGSAKEALPVLLQMQARGGAPDHKDWNTALDAAIGAIQTLPGPTLTYFKSITSVAATPPALKWPAATVTLTCSSTDLDKGVPRYHWSKLSGSGTVTFAVNDSTAASNCTATFSAPGAYVLHLACDDGSILDSSSWNWGYQPVGSQTYTNILGAVYATITVNVK